MIMLSGPGWVERKVIAHRSSTRSRERKEHVRERLRCAWKVPLGLLHIVVRRGELSRCCPLSSGVCVRYLLGRSRKYKFHRETSSA